jgi:hypothetical protein
MALRFSSMARPPALDRLFHRLGLVRRTHAAEAAPAADAPAEPAPAEAPTA